MLTFNGYNIRKEAEWVIGNATIHGTDEQIRYLVELNIIPLLCDLLTSESSRRKFILETLKNILKSGQNASTLNNGNNPYAIIIEECNGLDKIESLLNHQSEKVYKMSLEIIEIYFPEENNNIE